MDRFNFTNVTFAKADDGEWLLDSDWLANPPTPLEVESLLARTLLLDHLLVTFVHHFAAGHIEIAEGLEVAALEEVMRFVAAVRDSMTPPTAGVE